MIGGCWYGDVSGVNGGGYAYSGYIYNAADNVGVASTGWNSEWSAGWEASSGSESNVGSYSNGSDWASIGSGSVREYNGAGVAADGASNAGNSGVCWVWASSYGAEYSCSGDNGSAGCAVSGDDSSSDAWNKSGSDSDV